MVVSRAERDVQAKFLLRNGADEVLYPEKQLAKWAAIRYGSDHVLDYIELDHDHAILEVSVPSAWIGKTVGDINIRKKYSINILGIKRNGIADVNIDSDTVLPGDGTLLVLGEGKALSRCFHIRSFARKVVHLRTILLILLFLAAGFFLVLIAARCDAFWRSVRRAQFERREGFRRW